MKSKISSLSKNEDFKNLLSGRKINNQYSTIFFKKEIKCSARRILPGILSSSIALGGNGLPLNSMVGGSCTPASAIPATRL